MCTRTREAGGAPRADDAAADRGPHRAPASRRQLAIALCLIAGITAVHVVTLRSGHSKGGDFAQYLVHARNIVEGTDYAATGYIFNPYNPLLAPRSYPPVWPLLEASVLELRGLDITALKLLGIGFVTLLLVTLFVGTQESLGFGHRLALIVVVGLQPSLWHLREEASSDLPFLFFCFACLSLVDGSARSSGPQRARILRGVLVGLAMYAAYGTRSIGITLVPASVLALRPQERQAWLTLGPALLVFGVLAGVQVGLQGQLPYQESLGSLGLSYVPFHALVHAGDISRFLLDSSSVLARGGVLLLAGGLALGGYLQRARRRPTSHEWFAPLYAIVVLLWPVTGDRFLLPLFVLLALYALLALQALTQRLGRRFGRSTPFLLVLLCASYCTEYRAAEYGPWRVGPETAEWRDLFSAVQQHTPPAALIVFRKARHLPLYARRQGTPFHDVGTTDDTTMWRHFRAVGASHVIASRFDDPHVPGFLQRGAHLLSPPLFENAQFRLHAIVWPGEPREPHARPRGGLDGGRSAVTSPAADAAPGDSVPR